MKDVINSQQGKCLSCGGNLYFSPSTQDLFCAKCESHYSIKNDDIIKAHVLNEKLDKTTSQNVQDENNLLKCPNCGAKVILNKFEVSKKCPYCGAGLVKERNAGNIEPPDAIIPFAFDENVAGEKFVEGVKKKFWAPRKFKKQPPKNIVHGIYVPAFAYDAHTDSQYQGRLYDEYTEKDSDGHTHTRRSYFSVSGSHTADLENVIVEASSKITQNEIEGVLPYHYKKIKPYKNDYIFGYSVERYNKNVIENIPTYKDKVRRILRGQILSKYYYDGVDYLNISTTFSNEQYRYYILPIYRFDYEYKKKKYITYMNGQTGKVDGNVPKSKLKIALIILIPLLIILSIMFASVFISINFSMNR